MYCDQITVFVVKLRLGNKLIVNKCVQCFWLENLSFFRRFESTRVFLSDVFRVQSARYHRLSTNLFFAWPHCYPDKSMIQNRNQTYWHYLDRNICTEHHLAIGQHYCTLYNPNHRWYNLMPELWKHHQQVLMYDWWCRLLRLDIKMSLT